MPIGVSTGTNEGQKAFLAIVQDAVQECSVARQSPRLPTTVLAQVGVLRKFVDWTAEAWHEIQSLHDNWRFMRRDVTFALVDGQQEYSLTDCGIADGTFGRWDLSSFRCYETSAGLSSEMYLDEEPYDVWRDTYQFGAIRSSKSRPTVITESPDRGLGFGLTPSAGYSVTGQYFIAPEILEVDDDVPNLPIRHSAKIIVYKVMMTYGMLTPAPEVYAEGKAGYKRLLTLLENDQLPKFAFAGPMA